MPLNKQAILDDIFRKAPPLNSEDDCAENVVIPFIMRLGYDRNQIRRKVSITGTSGHRFRKQADIVVYIGERPALVVETKRIQHRFSEEDVNQALSYAQLLEPSTPIAVLTNGRDWEIYYLDRDDIGGLESVPEPQELESTILTVSSNVVQLEKRQAAERLLVTIENKGDLEIAFRECRKELAKEGLIAESAFDELTKILTCKFNEEKRDAEGLAANRFTSSWLLGSGPLAALQQMFTDAKQTFNVFPTGTQIQIRSNETVEKIVRELEPFGLYGFKTPLGLAGAGGDVVGSVYEAFLTGTLRGDLGQYLTPRQLVEFMVEIADIKIGEKVLDLSCGSGGFLIRAFINVRKKIRFLDSSQDEKDHLVSNLVRNNLWGIEINPRLATLCRINMILHGDGYEHIYTGDSIREDVFENTDGRRTDFLNIEQNNAAMFDVILINPPFNIPYEDSATLNRYYLGRGKAAQGSDYLVLERAIRLLKPETGRLLVILPHGVASGVSETEVRNFVKSRTHIHGCISLPVGSFKPFGGSNARTCVLYLKKTTGDNKKRFLAQAEQVGYDITSKYYRETDLNDLPVIAEAYHRVKLKLQ
ncbi:MAG: N-6 DNA methylase [Microcystis sp.]|jgi:type I restriction enzyme M protein|uniref:Restriction endonuclease subunit M n=1 Tax=Microcystis aeruginosa Ma_OC_H_19870700_S124 TaxID=2486262 RepID=A0A552AHM3_MICAE|nr:N-6 DNA methylase [Burkholderiales bacterium]NCQ90056.1 N-6 DNA methylase [Microcystis aeruginosa LG13-13]NCR03394.1 N-6 DNA methylase [Microcystis aeruginosa LG13-03]NCR61499.1 N-6 DNA methylase [Microcystis aeruginosa LG11-05]NCR70139.1 N-6 DNA methylase [Microcystis aeruginosa LG13-12]TRT84938.1 MAG: restriction endonuclease subunit M [Microcystis aeruginosa Ma_OC_H_19870700_S124]